MRVTSAAADAWSARAGRATRVLAAAAGLCLVAIVALVGAAVVLRYAFGRPLLGVNEVVQMVSVALVMLSLPWCTEQQAHVRADVFDAPIGPTGRFVGDLASRALSVVALSVLVHRAWLKMLDALAFGDATNMLRLPVWPFYGMIALGVGLCIPILVLQAAAVLARGRRRA